MSNVKYKDYSVYGHSFTVRFRRRYDLGCTAVDVEVLEQHTPRTGFVHRLIDFFKYNRYWHGLWLAGNEPLDDYALRLCKFVADGLEDEKDAEKFWNDIDEGVIL